MDHNQNEEKIVMTPIKKDVGHTILRLERIKVSELDGKSVFHEAGGNNKGIVIKKQSSQSSLCSAPELCLSFKVYLVNGSTNTHTKESRQLKFWFRKTINVNEQTQKAQAFFRALVNPGDFPRDYVGFIMKIMKLLQKEHPSIQQIEIDMKQLEEINDPPSRPSSASIDDNIAGLCRDLSAQKVLEIIESSYPNTISLADISQATQASEADVLTLIEELVAKNLVKVMGNNNFMRVTLNDTEVKLVKQMPKVMRSQQPTIAIITAQYCEKLAVDAMIDNKDTYVRFKTEGESNVYTLGNIGWHRVVSTKLPAVGHSRGAMIAAGNTTTRLLGTFQRLEYVFLVGVGGGVPHYTDFRKHVRLGDVVVSVPPEGCEQPYVYIHCEKVKNSPEERANGTNEEQPVTADNFNYRTWCPPNLELQDVAQHLWKQGCESEDARTWEQYTEQGRAALNEQESDFSRPPKESDKLYMSIGTKDIIEMGHPEASPDQFNPRAYGMPVIHFGSVGSGRMAVKDEQVRQDIASKYGILAFDSEFDTVAESVYGNRKDKYVFIRGISDYKDGTRKKDWQPYAALNAAAFMKAMIMTLSPLVDE